MSRCCHSLNIFLKGGLKLTLTKVQPSDVPPQPNSRTLVLRRTSDLSLNRRQSQTHPCSTITSTNLNNRMCISRPNRIWPRPTLASQLFNSITRDQSNQLDNRILASQIAI